MFWVVTALTGVGGFCRIIGVCFVFRVFASGWVFLGGGLCLFLVRISGFTDGNVTYTNLIICCRKRTKGNDEEAREKELNRDRLIKQKLRETLERLKAEASVDVHSNV